MLYVPDYCRECHRPFEKQRIRCPHCGEEAPRRVVGRQTAYDDNCNACVRDDQ